MGGTLPPPDRDVEEEPGNKSRGSRPGSSTCPLQPGGGGAGMSAAIRGHRLPRVNWGEGRGEHPPPPHQQPPWGGFHLTARREGAGAAFPPPLQAPSAAGAARSRRTFPAPGPILSAFPRKRSHKFSRRRGSRGSRAEAGGGAAGGSRGSAGRAGSPARSGAERRGDPRRPCAAALRFSVGNSRPVRTPGSGGGGGGCGLGQRDRGEPPQNNPDARS